MASAADTSGLPLLYRNLQPLSSNLHGDYRMRPVERTDLLNGVNAIPLTIDEFAIAQRHYPIVFSSGETPVPLALLALNDGINLFVEENGMFRPGVYVPAYARRYPFMLARLREGVDEMSLCFDPTTDTIGAFEEGEPLFVDGRPSDATKTILGFCEEFEASAQRTTAFVQELRDAKLLIDGEVAIQPDGADKPFVYRGFGMVGEELLRELRGDVARRMVRSGAMALIYAHLLSLPLARDLFAQQVARGLVPAIEEVN